MPFFSVIIPTYNRAYFLKIAIESVLFQTFRDFELIIVDDGSTDDTYNVIGEYLRHSAVKYIYQENHGPAAARNRGVGEAKGEFICFLDSDDRFRKEKLEISYQYIKRYPQYKIFHTEEIWYRAGKLLSPKSYHKKPSGFVFRYALRLCVVSISTAVIKRGVFEEIGALSEELTSGSEEIAGKAQELNIISTKLIDLLRTFE